VTVLYPKCPIDLEEKQIADVTFESRIAACERHSEPLDTTEEARLLAAWIAANETYLALGNKLYGAIAVRNRCEVDQLDDELRVRAQQLIDRWVPEHELLKVAMADAREEYFEFLRGK
jgi:hypothetical protein